MYVLYCMYLLYLDKDPAVALKRRSIQIDFVNIYGPSSSSSSSYNNNAADEIATGTTTDNSCCFCWVT